MANRENPLITEQRNQGDTHYGALVLSMTQSEIVKLPEYVFVRAFLPFFCGEKKITEQPNILPSWIGIAGSPSKEVDIVDEKGEILFRVPAMNDTSVIDSLNKKNGRSLQAIVQNYHRYQGITPINGENFLANAIADKIQAIRTTSESFTENEKKWNEIFIRYGKMKSTEPELVAVDKSSRLDEDEIEYD